MTLTAANDESIQAVIVRTSLFFLGIMVVFGALVSIRFSLSTLAGGLIVLLNHCWLRSILERVLAAGGENAARYAIIRYVLRLSLIALAVIILFRLNVDIAGLFAGLSILVISTVSVSIYQLLFQKGDAQ
ncbi:MAG: ATP synthase subunit I [Geobacter sp.]|nr:ATP synthase subunit I [Geobacter sp.]